MSKLLDEIWCVCVHVRTEGRGACYRHLVQPKVVLCSCLLDVMFNNCAIVCHFFISMITLFCQTQSNSKQNSNCADTDIMQLLQSEFQ